MPPEPELIFISVMALVGSALTFFSGFGLGTLMLPVFVLFFPLPLAVAATAAVHLANNIFKTFLVGKFAVKEILLRFAIPAVPAAFLGAWLLTWLGTGDAVASYSLYGRIFTLTPIKLVIGPLIIVFALFDLVPRLKRVAFGRSHLVLAGLVSGFFGGLSGHQGALRSGVLVKMGLSPEAFVGTGTVSAVMVDLARITLYGAAFSSGILEAETGDLRTVGVAAGAAFLGALIGRRFLGRITITFIRTLVGGFLLLVGAALTAGLL